MTSDNQKEKVSPSPVSPENTDERTPSSMRCDCCNEDKGRQSDEGTKLPAPLRRLVDHSPSLVLENSGSVARDHLASERTFLAYVRTSLVCAASGIALVQLIAMTPTDVSRPLKRLGKGIGAVTEVFGAGIMIIGLVRYFIVQKTLINGSFPAAGFAIWSIVFFITLITILTFGFTLAIALS